MNWQRETTHWIRDPHEFSGFIECKAWSTMGDETYCLRWDALALVWRPWTARSTRSNS